MGLGLLGKGLGDALFLARVGARLTVTDLKSEKELASSIKALKKYKNIRFVLGRHEMEDFESVSYRTDFVLKAQGVPLDSPYIAHANKNKIPIRMDDELAISLFPKNITIVGVTGTRGKTTVATLIHHILKKSGVRSHLAGNIQGVATLDLVAKVKEGDIVVLELSSWQLQGFHARKISPHIGVFTNFKDDHLNYYKGSRQKYFFDKSAIFKYQTKNDILILGSKAPKCLGVKAKKMIADKKLVPKDWKIKIPGEHNLENIASALLVAGALGVSITKIKKAVESFSGVHGRLQFVKEVRGIKIYNDNSSSTPDSTLTALKALSKSSTLNDLRSTILILGGADKGLNMSLLVKAIHKYCKAIVLLDGSGTLKLKVGSITLPFNYAGNLEDAVAFAMDFAQNGDTVLFSPAFASFGMFVNVYDREKEFMKIVGRLNR